MSEVELSIVIPCYNEELSINNLLIDIYDNFEDFKDYEIILVDDGSRTSLKRQNQFRFEKSKSCSNQK